MDAHLKGLARKQGCTFTRYADDISFSCKRKKLPPAIAEFDLQTKQWNIGDELTKVVADNGFKINGSKTRIRSVGRRLEVTGITINQKLNVSRDLVRQVRSMLHAWAKYGLETAQAEFLSKHDDKQRLKPPKDFARVVKGKIDFIGFVRGRDDELFLSLLARYSKCNPGAKIKPVVTGTGTTDKVLAQAIWLLESDDGMFQGTAFAVEGLGMLTAAHAVEQKKMFASRPSYDFKKYEVEVIGKNEHTDVARIKIAGSTPVQLPLEMSNAVQQGDDITLLGFPHYHVGDSVQIDHGKVIQSKVYSGVKHFISSCTIIKGNSGGPVLNAINKVVGIAVKGLEIKGQFSDKDQLSSFVPIDLAKGL